MNRTIAAVEGGGTTFRVAVCQCNSDNDDGNVVIPTILERTEIDSTTSPAVTLQACAEFLCGHKPKEGYAALAIASFGPVGLDVSKPTYGKILSTSPKQAWRNVDLLTPLKLACQGRQPLVCSVETDVNAPALAELQVYNNQQKRTSPTISSLAYVTVGTGVGLGLVVHNQAIHGRMHPEGGHVSVPPLLDSTFQGYSWGKDCNPYASINTVESLASAVALTERLAQLQGLKDTSSLSRNILATLDDNHEIWDQAAHALANMCVTLLLTTSVERIVLGGGLMKRKSLVPKIQALTVQLLNGYLEMPTANNMDELITTSVLGDDVGLIGAMVMGQSSLNDANSEDALAEKREIKQKQVAFNAGLVHGTIAGALLAGIAVKWLGFRRHGKAYR